MEAAAKLIEQILIYPLSTRDNPPKTKVVLATGKKWYGISPEGFEYWERVADIVNRIPADQDGSVATLKSKAAGCCRQTHGVALGNAWVLCKGHCFIHAGHSSRIWLVTLASTVVFVMRFTPKSDKALESFPRAAYQGLVVDLSRKPSQAGFLKNRPPHRKTPAGG